MSTNTLNGVHERSLVQQENGEATVDLTVTALSIIRELSDGWDESSQYASGLLQVLCTLGQDSPGREFGVIELAQAAVNAGRKNCGWGETILNNLRSEKETDQARKNLNSHWKKLDTLIKQKRRGIEQKLKESGLDVSFTLLKNEGGGTGRSNGYRIVIVNKDHGNSAESPHPLPGYDITYLQEDVFSDDSMAKRILSVYPMRGVRRIFIILSLLLTLLAAYALLGLMYLTSFVTVFSPLLFFTALTLLALGYVSVAPVYSAPSKGITVAPWWVNLFNYNPSRHFLLEWRSKHYEVISSSQLELTAYAGSSGCPFCKGKVSVKPGGLEFRGRLIGRCERAPVEHVFSFDHVTKSGMYLR